jgi:uncharacterized repeat protein (TIGR03803 family)
VNWAMMLVIVALASVAGAWAASGKVLHTFQGRNDGAFPTGSLIFDGSGNLFGTASFDGAYRSGTIFELTPAKHGRWEQRVIHAFTSGWDGADPGAGLVADRSGNFYGTTQSGGGGGCTSGCGVVFKLTPPGAGGKWKETVLHLFRVSRGGFDPVAKLAFDTAGNLYGTTTEGGGYNIGTAFKMWPLKGGAWKERILRSFTQRDGGYTEVGLIPDDSGNLYGTTPYGGAYGYGTVFELKRSSSGKWDEIVLHSFQQDDETRGGLIFDPKGNLYGTTFHGGGNGCFGGSGCGTVFELTPNDHGKWTESTLYIFAGGTDGAGPSALIFDSKGNLYGTTQYGGGGGCYENYGCGTVFKLTQNSRGGWTETLSYALNNIAGNSPGAGVILDSSGNLYGTTEYGGSGTRCSEGCGIVFEITP